MYHQQWCNSVVAWHLRAILAERLPILKYYLCHMQLNKLKQYIADYSNWLKSPKAEQRLHYWETQAHWQQNWDDETTDFSKMLDQCLQNSTTRRLWKREAYEPKRMLLAFAEMDNHFVFSMFQDLFNEDKDAHSRADRFVFYCDEMLQQYRRQHPGRIDNSHYHDDGYEMISLYFSFHYPERYAPYHAERLRALLQHLGAPNIPLAGDFPRHIKVMRTLQNFINKDEELLARHRQRLRAEHYQGESLLLAFDFACFVVER